VYRVLRRAFGHQHWWPGETRLEIIIGAILTQNTAWTNVEKAIRNLKRTRSLSAAALRKMPVPRLAGKIRSAGYFNVKASRIKDFLDFLTRGYQGSLARLFREETGPLRQELLGVRGIGPETADSILLYAGQKPSFVIDAYTRRIFSRHGLMHQEAGYESWKGLFESHLPRDVPLYNDFHAQIVHLAKTHCRSSEARCEGCPLQKYL